MKKNFAMRVAACLLVVTMLSLCMVSYTYAKYTTSDTVDDLATVAKWGIKLTVVGDDLLYDDEAKTTNDVDVKVTSNELAAPGTYQKLATVKLEGTPEVAYEIKVDVDLTLTNWKIDDTTEYCPLVFTVDNDEYKLTTTVAELETAIEKAIKAAICGEDDGLASYDAGTPVPTSANEVLIDWTWAFEGDNVKDTVLGNADTKATIGFELTVTVTQVD